MFLDVGKREARVPQIRSQTTKTVTVRVTNSVVLTALDYHSLTAIGLDSSDGDRTGKVEVKGRGKVFQV